MPINRTVSEDDLVPLEWCDGQQKTVDAWGQREYDCGVKVGREQGLKAASTHLEKVACEFFLKNDNPKAELLRRLATELRGIQ